MNILDHNSEIRTGSLNAWAASTVSDSNLDSLADFFFQDVIRSTPYFSGEIILVCHLLPTLEPMLRVLSKLANISTLLAKPNTIHSETYANLTESYKVIKLVRKKFEKKDYVFSLIDEIAKGKKFIIIDIGGYFSNYIDSIKEHYGGRMVGVVEDTENGHVRYSKALSNSNIKYLSVSRSRAKRTEDYWIGKSLVFSSEAYLRGNGITFNLKDIAVIGFGKIGCSIATSLKSRGYNVSVWDKDPTQRVFARSLDFRVETRDDLLKRADFIYCATGNKSINKNDIVNLKDGSALFSCTSRDDELDLDFSSLEKISERNGLGKYLIGNKVIYFANKGNAANFEYGAESRPYIYLVQAAILKGVESLLTLSANNTQRRELTIRQEEEISVSFENIFFRQYR